MADYQWLLNDELSVYSDDRGKVYTGYRNLHLPRIDRGLRGALDTFNSNIQRGLLTVSEQFEASRDNLEMVYCGVVDSIAKGKHVGILTEEERTIRERGTHPYEQYNRLGTIRVYKILYERLQYENWLYSKVIPGVGFHKQRVDVQMMILAAVQEIHRLLGVGFDNYFLNRLRPFMDTRASDRNPPSSIRERWKTSNYIPGGGPSTVESGMQRTITAASYPDPNPYVFSRTGSGLEADPVLDTLTLAFCRVIQDPDSLAPAADLDTLEPGVQSRDVIDMTRQGLSPFYPNLNYADIPTSYGSAQKSAPSVRSLLAIVRSLCANREVARGFGIQRALSRAYEVGGVEVQRMIVNAVDPYVTGAQLRYRDYDRSVKIVPSGRRQYYQYTFAANGREYSCGSAMFFAAMYLMDYLNVDGGLRGHAVKYLAWVKGKCEGAARRGDLIRGLTTPTIVTSPALRRLPALSLTRLPAGLNLLSRIPTQGTPGDILMLPGYGNNIIGIDGGDASGGGDMSGGETGTEPVVGDTSAQTAEDSTAASKTKWIAIGSAVVIAGVISTALIIKNKRAKQLDI
jgi:hypothetical protein